MNHRVVAVLAGLGLFFSLLLLGQFVWVDQFERNLPNWALLGCLCASVVLTVRLWRSNE